MMLLPVIPYTLILILFLMKRTSFFHYRYTPAPASSSCHRLTFLS